MSKPSTVRQYLSHVGISAALFVSGLFLISVAHASMTAEQRSKEGLSFGPSSGLSLEFRPSLPIFGGGPFVNIFESDQALENASAHVAWATAVPLVGEKIGGRKGLWISGLTWMGVSLAQEAFFHAPAHPGAGYPSEVRADLLTRLGPTAIILLVDWLNHRNDPPFAPKVEAVKYEAPLILHLKVSEAPKPASEVATPPQPSKVSAQ